MVESNCLGQIDQALLSNGTKLPILICGNIPYPITQELLGSCVIFLKIFLDSMQGTWAFLRLYK